MKTINFGENGYIIRTDVAEMYRKEMARYKVLNAEETKELVALAQEGDAAARTKVVNANLRIVWSIAANYNGLDEFMDILQNGNIGLIKAVETFDATKGVVFTTWALQMITKYIGIGLEKDSKLVRERADIARKSGSNTSVSVDAPIGSEDGENKTLLDFMASESKTDSFAEAEAARIKVSSLMRNLKPIEKEIVCALFGLGCREHSQFELSRKYNLTEERIRQIKIEAMAKMKKLG